MGGFRRVGVAGEKDGIRVPSLAYSSTVFFSPTLKPSVLEATRSSSPWDAMVGTC